LLRVAENYSVGIERPFVIHHGLETLLQMLVGLVLLGIGRLTI
jgi:hypothetical protein